MDKNKAYLPYVASTVSSAIFGLSFIFTKGALDFVKPLQLIGYRFALAAILLTILRLCGVIKVSYKGKPVYKVLMIALAQPLFYFIFETMGIQMTTASESGMMIALIPVFVTVLAAIFLKEKPMKSQLGFIALSVFGALFIIVMKSQDMQGNLLGMFMLFMAVICAAIYNILSRKYSVEFKPIEITYIMMCSGAICFNILGLTQAGIQGELSQYLQPLFHPKVMIAVVYLGILSSIIAFFLTNFSLSRLEASRSAVFANLASITSIVAGVIVLKEDFYWYQFVGAVCILVGVWGTNYFTKKRVKANKEEKAV